MDILTKECNIVHIIIKTLQSNAKEGEIFNSLCNIIPQVFNQSQGVSCKISFELKEYKSEVFNETNLSSKRIFEIPENQTGLIELFSKKILKN